MPYDLNQTELACSLQLTLTPGLGNLSFGRLMESYGSAYQALQKTPHDWQCLGISQKIYHRAQKPVDRQTLKRIEKWLLCSEKHHLISYNCADYPSALRALADPPAVLYARGNLSTLNAPTIAIIGSRQATPLGLKNTQQIAYELSMQGLSICSGLAFGIDSCAHLGALSANGPTVAFMGTGADKIYPKSSEKIADAMIEKQGLLVSELPLSAGPRGHHFPPRNRLICGLSVYGVVVIESKSSGGSMITARLAAQQGREVFALPGSIQSPLSEGCHLLIQQGAKLIKNTQDILDELPASLWQNIPHNKHAEKSDQHQTPKQRPDQHDSLSPEGQKVLSIMQFEAMRIEDIAHHSTLSIEALSTVLLELELEDKIQALSGNRWQRIS